MDRRPDAAAATSLIGCFVSNPQLSTCEVLAVCGFDVLVADAEHAPLSAADVQTIIAGADLAGLPALVRLSDDSATSIQYALDAGAAGRHRPARPHGRADGGGRRPRPPTLRRASAGQARGAHRCTASTAPPAMPEALDHTLIAVQIESAEAVENLDAMLAVEHLDMVFVGPNDLSHSLGQPARGRASPGHRRRARTRARGRGAEPASLLPRPSWSSATDAPASR